MLVQVAMIAFGMFGVLALVIDMGLVTLTRVQMQNAADAAAIIGMRERNGTPVTDPVTGAVIEDGYASDCVRRAAARQVVRWMFDDDFDFAADGSNFGAGPRIAMTAGEDYLSGSQLLVMPQPDDPADVRVYKPDLQLNQSENLAHGDMVSGTFRLDPASNVVEDSSYARAYPTAAPNDEFTPAAPVAVAPCPADPLTYAWTAPAQAPPLTDPAFLVRLRRTNTLDTLAEVDGVSSHGPALPFLFGRGTAIHEDTVDPPAAYNPRIHGVTVRATAIAATRPALRVSAVSGAFGAAPFALDAAFLTSTKTATIHADGTITGFLDSDPGTEVVVGAFVTSGRSVATVGAAVVAAPPPSCTQLDGFGPIYSAFSGGTNRVVGFVALHWSTCDVGPVTFEPATTPRVAGTDATAHVSDGFPPDMPPADVGPLIAANLSLQARPGAILAPVLVR